MVLPFWLFFGLGTVFIIGAAIGFIVFVMNIFRPKEVYISTGKRNKYVKLKDAPPKYDPQIRERLLARKRTAVIGFLVTVIAATFLIWSGVSGEATAQWKAHADGVTKSITERGAELFVEPPTFAEVKKMRVEGGSGDGVDITIYSVNGDAHTIPFVYGEGDSGSIFSKNAFRPQREADRASGIYDGAPVQEQAERKYRGEVYNELEDLYGVFLTDEQRAALLVPTETPEHLIRYGSTPLTTSLGDGTYFNGTVTLIWDDGYKLIGNEGTDQAAELARK